MINLICTIAVTVMAPLDEKVSVPWHIIVQAHGAMVAEGPEAYVVNFSKDAKKNGWVGEYKDLLVSKSMCVRVK